MVDTRVPVHFVKLACVVCREYQEFGPFVLPPSPAIGSVHRCARHGGWAVRVPECRQHRTVFMPGCEECGELRDLQDEREFLTAIGRPV